MSVQKNLKGCSGSKMDLMSYINLSKDKQGFVFYVNHTIHARNILDPKLIYIITG